MLTGFISFIVMPIPGRLHTAVYHHALWSGSIRALPGWRRGKPEGAGGSWRRGCALLLQGLEPVHCLLPGRPLQTAGLLPATCGLLHSRICTAQHSWERLHQHMTIHRQCWAHT